METVLCFPLAEERIRSTPSFTKPDSEVHAFHSLASRIVDGHAFHTQGLAFYSKCSPNSMADMRKIRVPDFSHSVDIGIDV